MSMNFDQIFVKSDNILTIYVKNHSMHVNKIQERHFSKSKNPTSRITQDLGGGDWGIGEGIGVYIGGDWGVI